MAKHSQGPVRRRCCGLRKPHWCSSISSARVFLQVAISSAPQFIVGVQLGKGGFGQVFKGSRAYPRATKDPTKPMQVGRQRRAD